MAQVRVLLVARSDLMTVGVGKLSPNLCNVTAIEHLILYTIYLILLYAFIPRGLSPNSFYALLAAATFILFIPVCWMKELQSEDAHEHTLSEFRDELWNTMKSKTTLYMIIYGNIMYMIYVSFNK